ncbi:MAG: aspartate kinase [Desulfovibrio sp.]|uniref:aspartate kinase n=1 Tax=Desulfovibrio sp. 7SRBS1 TaxID=3378064 RepID=UPI003B415FE5
MNIIVQKFGGTSVANRKRMGRVLEIVQRNLQPGNKLLVVLSAMSGETNRLVGLGNEWSSNPDPAEMDVLLTTGEQASTALFAMLCKDAGIKARSLQGHQICIRTNQDFGRARILSIDSQAIFDLFNEYDVLVVAGFQGCDCNSRVTTLGRGGSDTSAVALAAAIKATTCEIFTDVDGVYTTDPNVCSAARKLNRVSYDEMLEMASMGAKVLQIRSVEFAKKYNVPVHVRSTFSDECGTIVSQEDKSMEYVLVSGIAYDKDQARVTVFDVLDQPGVASSIFTPLAQQGVLVDMIIQNTSRDGHTDMTFTVQRADLQKTLDALNAVKNDIGAKELQYDTGVCKVSVIGVGMRNHSGVASKSFEALRDEGINLLMISTSEIKITMLIEDKYAELAVRTLHEAFELDKAPAERVCEL